MKFKRPAQWRQVIYHIAFAAEWERAREGGTYEWSTRGRTLAEVGFVHASNAEQVNTVANSSYSGDDGLIVLVIDENRLTSELRYDPVPGSDDPFPHIYGPLDINAVIDTIPLRAGPDGRFRFSAPH